MRKSILALQKQVEELKQQRNFTRRSAITHLLDSLIKEQKLDQMQVTGDEEGPTTTANEGGGDV